MTTMAEWGAAAAAAVLAAGGPDADTLRVPLSGTGPDDAVPWEFKVSSERRAGEAASLPVPSHWEFHGFGRFYYGHEKVRPPEQGRYGRWFFAPADWAGRRVRLRFEGAMTDTEVSVNGRRAGPKHQGGFYPFSYDITELVRFGASNRLDVAVDKVSANPRVEDAERIADYWVFGGIFRPVALEILPPEHIEHVAIRAEADGTFNALVRTAGATDRLVVAVRILDPAGQEVGDASATTDGRGVTPVSLRVPTPAAWNAETPVLYRVEVELRREGRTLHRVAKRFGFRTFEVRPGAGLFLNGRRILLKGVCRHAFRPDSGRCLSPRQNVEDVRLIRSMNMNAVRCSHYPPDEAFLDACDELGLYVLDELAGWQKEPYDTPTGERLVRAMVERDQHHPSILFWDNGNEGGWNTDLDDDFHLHDPWRRPVLHPWAKFSGVDTDHYETYAGVARKLDDSSHVFLPTEHLHGLFDGGGGAGLADHWALMKGSRNAGGLFLWVLADEGVAREDRGGVIDVDGFHAPDGMVGPHHEKEGSFFAIQEIWCPVRVVEARRPLPAGFDGRLTVSNEHSFADLGGWRFEWRLRTFADARGRAAAEASGEIAAPAVPPGGAGTIRLPMPAGWAEYDVLAVGIRDATGDLRWTWTWPLPGLARTAPTVAGPPPVVAESPTVIEAKAGRCAFAFRRSDGRLDRVRADGATVPLCNGPRLAAASSDSARSVRWRVAGDTVEIESAPAPNGSGGAEVSWTWRIAPGGDLSLAFRLDPDPSPAPFRGITFDWPESAMRSARWLGGGPARVWRNRMEGTRLDLFERADADPVPAETWSLPEFKGYFAEVRWIELGSAAATMTALLETPGMFARIGTPRLPRGDLPGYTRKAVEYTFPPFPGGDVSFLFAIPPIGTKFSPPDDGAPSGVRASPSPSGHAGRIVFRFGAAR